jgi:hypothetical protein
MEEPFKPAALFEVLLPAILNELGPATRQVGAVVQLDLLSDSDYRTFHVDFAQFPAVLVEGEHPAPHLAISLEAAVVLPMLTGELDVELALEDGEIEIAGDPAVLERLSALFGSGLSELEAQIHRATSRSGDD